MIWTKYVELDPIRHLPNEGRELIGEICYCEEKRDGEQVSIWLDDENKVRVSSHHLETASSDIYNRFVTTRAYLKAVELLQTLKADYHNNYILYGELIKIGASPTRIERKHKRSHWVLFDIYDTDEKRFLDYTLKYQHAFHFHIPMVRLLTDPFAPNSLEEIQTRTKQVLAICKRKHKEGFVLKCYTLQLFAKEKIDVPHFHIQKPRKGQIQLPPMPPETISRALGHAIDAVGLANWTDKRQAMPQLAKHLALEASEHSYSRPNNMYEIYCKSLDDNNKGQVI